MKIEQQVIEQLNREIIEQFGGQVAAQIQHHSEKMSQEYDISEPDYENFEEKLRDAIHDVTGIDPELLNSRSRNRKLVQARQLFHFFMNKYTSLSLGSVGDKTGHNHATVIHSCRTILALSENNKEIKYLYNKISEKL